ncbi:alpha/beta hydrolase [Nocardioides sp.]|uniref:alpha/beta hydrolase n=1 Tax=Nocardioides sp. TaxID=35761 RepID=UPI001A27FBBB|nr:alpha/beta hydrolase [Nocardioides sp.]MBJ7356940.1 alpha/beta hydrolase [Nocardioides sp.]
MPSRRHELLAYAVPRLRRSRDLDDVEVERARLERWHTTLDRGFPTSAVRRFHQRFRVTEEQLPGGFPCYTLSERGASPDRVVVYVHGGGFVAPIDPYQVKYAARLATALDAQVVMPDYPLTPEHTWRDSHEDVVRLVQRAAETSERVVVVGDSAGGGIALAAALTVRDRGGPQPSHLLLHAPWVDLTTSTPETAVVTLEDPWLFIGKMHAYAEWWAGSGEDLGRPEVSPALADLGGLPRALMFSGTRDTLMPGCRLLARRAVAAGWDLTYVEQPGLLHVYPLLPFIPEAKQAWWTTLEFLR